MSIEWARVEAIIREDPGGRTARPNGECPTPEELVRFVERRMKRKARLRTSEHLASCADCARIVQSLLRLSRDVDRLTGSPGAVQSRPSDLPEEREESSTPPIGRKLALAGLAALVGVAVISIFVIRLSERPAVRGAAGPEVKLIVPKKGEAITAGDVKFRWEAVPKASHYVAEIFGRSLEKVWGSEPVSEPSLEVPAEALQSLVAGEAYFWRIKAVMEEGREVASRLSEFSIRK